LDNKNKNKIRFLGSGRSTFTEFNSEEVEKEEASIIIKIKKGKHASCTENRRMVWEYIVWPLILQVNRQYFTLEEYRINRDRFSRIYTISTTRLARGLISLIAKGMLMKNKSLYSIDYRLVSYMRKKINLEYGLAVKKMKAKQ
jgi:hypothetical protein